MFSEVLDGMVTVDPTWDEIVSEAELEVEFEPSLSKVIGRVVLECDNLGDSIGKVLTTKLQNGVFHEELLQELFAEYWSSDYQKKIGNPKRDLLAIRERDPACTSYLIAFLHMKGFQALQAQRLMHWLWHEKREHLAIALQCRVSELFGVDIHPAAKIGGGIVIDHATNVVIGETSILGNDITMLQGVTLGGTGKSRGDRHPKIRDGVHIWAGAKILGNIELGEHCQVGACSVVLDHVPPHATVVGVPAKVVKSNALAANEVVL